MSRHSFITRTRSAASAAAAFSARSHAVATIAAGITTPGPNVQASPARTALPKLSADYDVLAASEYDLDAPRRAAGSIRAGVLKLADALPLAHPFRRPRYWLAVMDDPQPGVVCSRRGLVVVVVPQASAPTAPHDVVFSELLAREVAAHWGSPTNATPGVIHRARVLLTQEVAHRERHAADPATTRGKETLHLFFAAPLMRPGAGGDSQKGEG